MATKHLCNVQQNDDHHFAASNDGSSVAARALLLTEEGPSSSGDEIGQVEREPERQFWTGILLSILSALCFAVTAVLVKKMTDISPAQLALFRYIGML